VFGPGKVNFVNKVIDWSKGRDKVRIVDDQVSSPTYTFDLAEASLDIVGTGMCGLYHITNSGSCSRFEWAEYILSRRGWQGNLLPVSSREFPTAAKRPRYSVLDNFGSTEILGYSLPDWKDATARYLARVI
jgi:dTDP-4-dehydrorhamnose reductase